MKNIAIISPNKNAYSETFIQAHKNLLKGNIHYLHGGNIPTNSDKNGNLMKYYWKHHFLLKLLKLLPAFFYHKLKKQTNNDYLKFYLKNEKIEIVLAEYGVTGAVNLELLKELNIKLIVHFHGFDASVKQVITKYKTAYKEMFEYANSIIVVSNVMKQKIFELGCPEKKLVLNTYGPNQLFLDIEPIFSKKQFIAIGRFVDKKAPYYTIVAFQKVLQKHPDAKLIFGGDGFLINTSKNIAKMLNISKNVIFFGVIPPEDFKKYLKESLAFVQHSITAENGDMEGTPVAVLEASAAGLPVISTFHAGIPDVIINEETGLLVEEHDVDGMAKNMLRILDDIQLAGKLGEAGKKRVIENFTMEKHISTIQKLIDNE